MNNGKIIDLMNLLLGASDNPVGWDLTLEKLAEIFGANAGAVEFIDLGSGGCSISAAFGIRPEFKAIYERQYGPSNPYLLQGRSLFRAGAVVPLEHIIPMADFRRTEFYQEYLRPQSMEHFLVANLIQEGDLLGNVILTRPPQEPSFDGVEISLLQSLLPALTGALAANRRVARLQAEHKIAQSLLNHMQRGVVLLDAHGKIVMINRSAMTILEGRDGLMYEDSGIRAVLPEENQRFKQLLQAALEGNGGPKAAEPASMLVNRATADAPLALLVVPVGHRHPLFDEPRGRAAVFISAPELCPKGAAKTLRGLFAFTEAEARVAVCLMKGLSIEECAARLGITPNTARTHLKRLFVKTSTNRQGELVCVLLQSPATLDLNPG